MELHAKLVRSQLNFFKPLAENCSLELTRRGQDKLGELMTAMHRRETFSREHDFRNFQGAWIMPKDQRRTGVILYLHGGGYTCGSLEYARGFASTLATECGVRVFCAAYRLAPEHPYPAALEDALESYEYLLKKGYPARQILLCGESAGGGLIYALCLKLKELGRPLPCGLVGISPWTDLTSSGASFETNRDAVSYTHLDVYKRQEQGRSRLAACLSGAFCPFRPGGRRLAPKERRSTASAGICRRNPPASQKTKSLENPSLAGALQFFRSRNAARQEKSRRAYFCKMCIRDRPAAACPARR